MKRGGLCTYAAVIKIIDHRRTRLMQAFLGAAAWAGLFIVPLSWWLHDEIMLASTHHQLGVAMIGGLILGVGAYINRGCVFGTFVHLVGGNMNYLGTLLGLASGVLLINVLARDITPMTHASTALVAPALIGFVWLAVMGVLAITLALRNRKLQRNGATRIMLTLGFGGGLLFAIVSGWDFASVISLSALKSFDLAPSWPAMLPVFCTLLMVAGGIYAAVSAGNFHLQTPVFLPFLSSVAGGVLMGIAAYVVPGGNDGMLLKGIPAFAPHAIVGYMLMVGVMLVLRQFFSWKMASQAATR